MTEKYLDIKKIRESLGLTQKEFGDRLSLTRRTIQNYEDTNKVPNYIQKLIHYEFYTGENNSQGGNKNLNLNTSGRKNIIKDLSVVHSSGGESKKNEIKQLKEKIKDLEKQLERSHKQIDFLQDLINKQITK